MTLLSPPNHLSSRIDHQMKVGVPQCKSNAYFEAFIPKTSQDWNRLPASIVTIADHDVFKSAICDHVLHL